MLARFLFLPFDMAWAPFAVLGKFWVDLLLGEAEEFIPAATTPRDALR